MHSHKHPQLFMDRPADNPLPAGSPKAGQAERFAAESLVLAVARVENAGVWATYAMHAKELRRTERLARRPGENDARMPDNQNQRGNGARSPWTAACCIFGPFFLCADGGRSTAPELLSMTFMFQQS